MPEVNRRHLYEKKRFGDKPVLKKMLENGEASINKLERIAFIATAEKVKSLPTSALKTFVKDVRQFEKAKNGGENQDDLLKPLFGDKFTDVRELNFEIADDVKQQLNELNSIGIDVNELLREMLGKRQEKIAEEKKEIAKNAQTTQSRYISTQKPAKIIHHTQRFSLSQNHDPRFLAPLCKEHHIIAHSLDLKYFSNRVARTHRFSR